MNAQTTITPAWAKYLPAVQTLKPAASEPELRHRANLMHLRDKATKALETCSWEAAHIFRAVVTIAAQHALTDMPPEQIESLRFAVLRTYLSACQVELAFPAADDGR